jgi:hypothetical protein
MTPTRIDLPAPAMGGKVLLLDRHGLFVLEEGPSLFLVSAVTHAGSSSIEVIDGVPDAHGRFPGDGIQADDPEYHARNGRRVMLNHPTAMGAWPVSGGTYHGLCVKISGGRTAVPPIVTIVWMASRGSPAAAPPEPPGPAPAPPGAGPVNDVVVAPHPGSLLRAAVLDRPGVYRLARRSCQLDTVFLGNLGSWAQCTIYTGAWRPVLHLPTMVTGTFKLGGYCERGLLTRISARSGASPLVSVSWREPDQAVV